MSRYELEDKLVEGTGTYKGYFPPHAKDDSGKPLGPRMLPTTIRQGYWRDGDKFIEAYKIVGVPVAEEILNLIRVREGLSENYGVVLFPKNIIQGVDLDSPAVVEDGKDDYFIRGLLPSESLRWESNLRSYTLREEGLIYTAQTDFPKVSPEELMSRWESSSLGYKLT